MAEEGQEVPQTLLESKKGGRQEVQVLMPEQVVQLLVQRAHAKLSLSLKYPLGQAFKHEPLKK